MNLVPPRIRAAAERLLFPLNAPLNRDDGIEQYRGSIVRFLSLASLVAGLAILVPEILIGIRLHRYLRPAVEIFFYICYLIIYLRSRMAPRRNACWIVLLCLAMGVYLFIEQGLVSSGPTWLMTASALAAVLFGAPGGAIVAGIDALIFLAIAWGSSAHLFAWRMDFVPLAIAGLNVVCLALVSSLSEAFLVRYLRSAMAARDNLNSELEVESAERRGAEAQISFYRDFDPLTRLLNREKFVSAFSQALPTAERRGRIIAVLVLGLDRFGRVNESFGHAVGDAVLVATAEALRGAFREDDVLGRLGNDLFAVLCTDVKRSDDVIELIEKANKAFKAPIDANGVSVRVGASIGLALFPNDGCDAEDLLLAAEAALRLAKESGPGSYRDRKSVV